MYAAHFAAALAIKARAPAAPAWALLVGVFAPDVCWIALAAAGVEPTDPAHYFDGFSHSLASVLVEATAFAALFLRQGRAVAAAVWLAVASHFLLDLPIHPTPLQLWPHSPLSAPWDLWSWGEVKGPLGFSRYWWIQLGVTLPLLAVYLTGARKAAIAPNLAAASAITVLGLHMIL
jgi:membrane-bound metal-dependent hydrolase YbcI (DUF457 family)